MSLLDDDRPKTGASADTSDHPASMRIDEAIKHLFTCEKQALISFVNGALGANHDSETAEFVELNTEFIRMKSVPDEQEQSTIEFDLEKIIADMIFTLDGVAYHIEFQTTADNTIVIRIMGYGIEHAMSGLRAGGIQNEVSFELPVPVLIQIDKDEKLPDSIPETIKLSGREDVYAFDITVIKLWEYDVEALVARGFYLLLPFLLVKYRKGKKTAKKVEAFVSDLRKVEDAISELYHNKMIFSNLRVNLYLVTNSIAQSISDKYNLNDPIIDKELKNMDATRALFAHEIEAKGKLKTKAEITSIIRMYLQKIPLEEISEKLYIPLPEVTGILVDSGLLEQIQ